MRDYKHVDRYINELLRSVYDQPEDTGHTTLAQQVIDKWMSSLPSCKSVLDVGAGQGFCQGMFEKWGVGYEGVALGNDVLEAQRLGRNVKRMDYTFLDYNDESFDLVFSRHSLEHSFSPLLSLMEWHRVSKQWLGLVVPAPEHYGHSGRNHYYVLNMEQWTNLLEQAGWHPIWIHDVQRSDLDRTLMEYCIFSEKKKRMEYK